MLARLAQRTRCATSDRSPSGDQTASTGPVDPLLCVPPDRRGGRLSSPAHWSYVGWACGALLPADVGVTAGLPPLLLATAPTRPTRVFQFLLAFVGAPVRAEGRAVVGGAPPAPPPRLGPAGGHPLARCEGLLVEPRRAGSSATSTTRPADESIKDFARFPELALAEQLPPACRRSLLGGGALPHRRLRRCWCGASSSAPCCCGTAPSPSTR